MAIWAASRQGVRREGVRCERPDEVRPAISAALQSSEPALEEAVVAWKRRRSSPAELEA
jgi:thiamine pyrophosphate-dependent acetolactate synthase large subunit-like protein